LEPKEEKGQEIKFTPDYKANEPVFGVSSRSYQITTIRVGKEMILDAAETVLGFFGFVRAVYSNLKRNNGKRKWRWFEELREQRTKDIETEML
jgi:hypothetical protein